MSAEIIARRKQVLQQKVQQAQQNAQAAAQAHAHWQAEALGAAAALREIEELEQELAGSEGDLSGAIDDDDDQTGAPPLHVVRSKKGEATSEE